MVSKSDWKCTLPAVILAPSSVVMVSELRKASLRPPVTSIESMCITVPPLVSVTWPTAITEPFSMLYSTRSAVSVKPW